ncbi:plasmid stabilization system (plasmid) [Rhizobium grahamii CCGE 502]|uniref:Plasmid stabilization system n=1 Tax=Rhizobium grahamii CCGE 502 TaxID=990285 RepID=S3HKE3_9HYPH|nr:plasmid stabilization system [Rhizobium grahamii CCGE 502]
MRTLLAFSAASHAYVRWSERQIGRTNTGVGFVATPYIIFYTVHDDNFRIERVLHGARDIEAIL